VCDLETSRMGAPYIYDISHLRVKEFSLPSDFACRLSLLWRVKVAFLPLYIARMSTRSTTIIVEKISLYVMYIKL